MTRIHITVPLGIGDCHWVCTKMRAFRQFIEARLGRPVELVCHVANRGPNQASSEYMALTPFFDEVIDDDRGLKGVPEEYKHQRWSTVDGSAKWREFDFCFQSNGHLERGDNLATWLPELGPPEYYYPLSLLPSVDHLTKPRILLYPSGVGPNRGFMTHWDHEQWQAILTILNGYGHVPTFVGANIADDLDYFASLKLRGDFEDLVGKTSLHDYLCLLKYCRVWFGLSSGGGIMSATFHRPTIMLWNTEVLHPNLRYSWLEPGYETYYHALAYRDPGMESIAVKKLLDVLKGDHL